MKLSSQIKPISYLKAHAAEIVRDMGERREPLVITQNGEAKMVLQDIRSHEDAQETMALLKILALGNRQIESGKVTPAAAAIKRLRARMLFGPCRPGGTFAPCTSEIRSDNSGRCGVRTDFGRTGRKLWSRERASPQSCKSRRDG